MGTVVETEADIDALHGGHRRRRCICCSTPATRTWGGADPAALARRYRARISHVHAKDVREAVMRESTREDWSFLDAVLAGVYTVPGDGCIDYRRGASANCRAIPAGSWSRPSRTRRRPIR